MMESEQEPWTKSSPGGWTRFGNKLHFIPEGKEWTLCGEWGVALGADRRVRADSGVDGCLECQRRFDKGNAGK